jgi:hypothetical protein
MKAERVGLLLSSADEAPRLKVVSPIPTSEAADKLEQSKEANTAENEPVPEPEVVQVSLGPLKVVSLEVTQARLTWEEPVYLPKSQADPDQLPLKCARFEVDWVSYVPPKRAGCARGKQRAGSRHDLSSCLHEAGTQLMQVRTTNNSRLG